MSHTLKLRDAEPVIPGLALPEAFEALDNRLNATVQLCQLKGSSEAQLLGMVTVCQELQRLLKFAFIENGMLASRFEILTRYSTETIKKMEKKLADAELQHKATKKQLRRIRKRLSNYETLQRKKHQKWWNINVSSSDYDSFTTMNRSSGAPDLEFMLRINQIMIDFVEDQARSELVLPPMGNEERAELSKLASVYKLRCRYGKALNLAPSTLIKARQAHTPAPGEVDAILENFAKAYKRLNVELEGKNKGETSDEKPPASSPPLEVPSSMLTPLSSSTVVDMGAVHASSAAATPSQTPPASGLNTPTGGEPSSKSHQSLPTNNGKRVTRLSISAMLSSQEKGRKSSQSESPLPVPGSLGSLGSSSPLIKAENLKMSSSSGSKGLGERSLRASSPLGLLLPASALTQRGQQTQTPAKTTQGTSFIAPLKQGMGTSTNVTLAHQKLPTSLTSGKHNVMQQSLSASHPTVVASPLLKVPKTQLPSTQQHQTTTASSGGGAAEGAAGSKMDTALACPPKRIRLTRKTAGLLDEF